MTMESMVSTLSSSLALPRSSKPRSTAVNRVRSRPLSSSLRISGELEVKQRRSASYHPTIWETNHIESFDTPYSYKSHEVRLEELKQMARFSLETMKDPRALLTLVDTIRRLGVAYHFEDEIDEAVSLVYRDESIGDLYTTALKFRVLREHGRPVGSEVFNRFLGQDGKFRDGLSGDVEGLVSLFDATWLGMPGEDVSDRAESFAMTKLRHYFSSGKVESDYLGKQAQKSLEVPLHWRMPRLEARNFIDLYERRDEKTPTLLELAKLDYNLVQSVHQDELKVLARWWRDLGFKENLRFARDRLMENYLWAMGIAFEPQFSKCRVGLTKFVCILTAIDDIYDVYGSLDELESFTEAIERWDIEAMVDLPLYMKICYLAMLNFGNEIIYDVLKNHGLDVSSYIKGEWLNLCRSYLVEARWFNNKYIPTHEEYLANARTSVGGPAAMVHARILSLDHSAPKASLKSCFNNASELIQLSSLITRLSDGLGTSEDESKRGDVAKSVECYMVEKGVSREEAQNQVKRVDKAIMESDEQGSDFEAAHRRRCVAEFDGEDMPEHGQNRAMHFSAWRRDWNVHRGHQRPLIVLDCQAYIF